MALAEIKSGRKRSHWMWYIFPQFKGLGYSDTSKFYAINDSNEARLREISTELLQLEQNDAFKVMGSPDDLKLKSSMTLFNAINETEDNVFKKVVEKFFNGTLDNKTINLLKNE